MNNNIEIARQRPCTGCFACSIVCTKGAIKMEQDRFGFYHPRIDGSHCVNCGACVKVCYSHDASFENVQNIHAYYGWNKCYEIRRTSASGGFTQAIASSLIKTGFTVIGCSYDNYSKKAKHILVKTNDDINRILGSKYFQSDLEECAEFIKSIQRSANKKYVFFGTPCQIHGIKKACIALGYPQTNFFYIELFCHGIVSPLVWSEYIKSLKYRDSIVDVKFRTKRYSWHIPCNEFILRDGTKYSNRVGDSFFSIFYSKKMFNKACYDCKARQNMGMADVRIGDFWGKRFRDNKDGVSCVLTFSSKGEAIVNQCKESFEFVTCDLDEILSEQSYDKIYPFDEKQWIENYEMIKNKGIKNVARHIGNQQYAIHTLILLKVKALIKNTIYR